jgi:glutamate racemase
MLGFYDSGIGGFSILNEFIKIAPEVKFNYLADTQIMPLGEKSQDFIQSRVKKAVSFLFDQGSSLVLLACNTAAVNSIREIQQNWLKSHQKFKDKQVLSLTKPLIEELENLDLKNQKGLLIATKKTIQSGFYQQELFKINYLKTDFLACANLATAIENQDKNVQKILQTELSFDAKILEREFIILACTHYPLIKKEIKKVFKNQKIKIIDPSKVVAQKLKIYIQKHPEYKILNNPNRFWTTLGKDSFDAKIKFFLNFKSDSQLIRL